MKDKSKLVKKSIVDKNGKRTHVWVKPNELSASKKKEALILNEYMVDAIHHELRKLRENSVIDVELGRVSSPMFSQYEPTKKRDLIDYYIKQQKEYSKSEFDENVEYQINKSGIKKDYKRIQFPKELFNNPTMTGINIDYDSDGYTAHFDYNNGSIFLGGKTDAFSTEKRTPKKMQKTIIHELGHAFFHLNGYVNSNIRIRENNAPHIFEELMGDMFREVVMNKELLKVLKNDSEFKLVVSDEGAIKIYEATIVPSAYKVEEFLGTELYSDEFREFESFADMCFSLNPTLGFGHSINYMHDIAVTYSDLLNSGKIKERDLVGKYIKTSEIPHGRRSIRAYDEFGAHCIELYYDQLKSIEKYIPKTAKKIKEVIGKMIDFAKTYDGDVTMIVEKPYKKSIEWKIQ